MTIPPLDEHGNLHVGIHPADWEEIYERFGSGTPVRVRRFNKLKFLHKLASLTQELQRFLIFGSFVSNKPEPRDVDIVLIMDEGFKVEDCRRESKTLFNHADADARFGASVFWIRGGQLSDEMMNNFFDVWQTRRDGKKCGMLEVIDDSK